MQSLCTVNGVLAHFLFSQAFFWMAIEGWHLYNILFRVAKNTLLSHNQITTLSFIASGLIVGITFGMGEYIGEAAYGNLAM